jgi:glucose/arabinose dehydrogenase
MHVHRSRCGWLHSLLLATLATACGQRTPDPPGVTPGEIENVTGTELLGWMQNAPDAATLATFRYAIYIDGVRSELGGSACHRLPFVAAFQCSAPLPPLAPGMHTVELATFTLEGGGVLESARSAAMQVNKAATVVAAPAPGPAATAWPGDTTIPTADGLTLRLELVSEGLSEPVDMAFTPDGRLFVAEERGRIRMMTAEGRLLTEPALSLENTSADLRLVAVDLDSQFDRTRFVYVLSVSAAPDGVSRFTLTRFQEASNRLFGGVVLLDGVPASTAGAAGSLRAGADGTLFVALDDGGDPRRAGDASSPNGKILRLNPDGTTPGDQAALSPMYAMPFRAPRGVEWQPGSNLLWIADQTSEAAAVISAYGKQSPAGGLGASVASYTLPRGTRPSSLTFHRDGSVPALENNLLVASDDGQHLLRVRLDALTPTRVISTERLLRNAIGGIRVVVSGPGGKIYLATSTAIATLAAAGR